MRDEFLVFGAPVIEEAEIAEVVDSLRARIAAVREVVAGVTA